MHHLFLLIDHEPAGDIDSSKQTEGISAVLFDNVIGRAMSHTRTDDWQPKGNVDQVKA